MRARLFLPTFINQGDIYSHSEKIYIYIFFFKTLVSPTVLIQHSTTPAMLQLANSWLKSDRRAGLAAGLAAGGVNGD